VDNGAALLGLRWRTRKAATGGEDEDTRQKELDVGRVERRSHDKLLDQISMDSSVRAKKWRLAIITLAGVDLDGLKTRGGDADLRFSCVGRLALASVNNLVGEIDRDVG